MPGDAANDLQQCLERIAVKLGRARAILEAEPDRIPTAELLRLRARELARPERPEASEERLTIIEFALGIQRLACEQRWVAEVFRPREVTPVPGAPPPVAGLVNRRGTILPVLDLRPILDLAASPQQESTLLLVLAGEGVQFGFPATRVTGAAEILRRDLAPAPETWPEPALRYLRGVLPGALFLLDAGRLLAAMAPRLTAQTSTTP